MDFDTKDLTSCGLWVMLPQISRRERCYFLGHISGTKTGIYRRFVIGVGKMQWSLAGFKKVLWHPEGESAKGTGSVESLQDGA